MRETSETQQHIAKAQAFEELMLKDPIVQEIYAQKLAEWSVAKKLAKFTQKELEAYARNATWVEAQYRFQANDDEGSMEAVQFLAWADYHTNIHPAFNRALKKIADYMTTHQPR